MIRKINSKKLIVTMLIGFAFFSTGLTVVAETETSEGSITFIDTPKETRKQQIPALGESKTNTLIKIGAGILVANLVIITAYTFSKRGEQ